MSFKSNLGSLEGLPIVAATAMADAEAAGGSTPDVYMQKAAEGVFQFIRNQSVSHLTFLCGKGNKAGDAYSVGERALAAGIPCIAYQTFPWEECSTLCQEHGRRFAAAGGLIKPVDPFVLEPGTLVVDGLLGTGFKGSVDGPMAHMIEKVNQSDSRVLAIDIPSGVDGNTGEVNGSAIFADWTAAIGFPKIGHFYQDGFEHLGGLVPIDIGLPTPSVPFGYMVNKQINLPKRKRTANKYTSGQVICVAGSSDMPGAACLATKAAYKVGAGVVRLYYPSLMDTSGVSPEVIRSLYHLEGIKQELPRTKALLVGSGLGRGDTVKGMLEELYRHVSCPIVIDGDALYCLGKPPSHAVLTPHAGEARRLFGFSEATKHLALVEAAQKYADKYNVVIVLKGAPTTIISAHKPKIVVPYGCPAMATAGMGDVLAGMIAGILAQGVETREAAVMGVVVHGLAGEKAEQRLSRHAMTASDLLDSLHLAFRETNS